MLKIVAETAPMLPAKSPRYLMGVGTPHDLLEAVARGIDMFDCVLPTRNGRHGMAFTRYGAINLSNARHANDARPLDEEGPAGPKRYWRQTVLMPPPTGKITSTLQKQLHGRPAGDTGISLGAEPFEFQHDPPLALLDLTLGEVLVYSPNVKKTRIPRCWKCSRRVCQCTHKTGKITLSWEHI